MELAALIGRLNADSRRALERAAQRCLQRTHHYVEIEHLLLELLDIEGGDLAWLLPRFGLERDAVATEINRALELFKAGSTRTPAARPDPRGWCGSPGSRRVPAGRWR